MVRARWCRIHLQMTFMKFRVLDASISSFQLPAPVLVACFVFLFFFYWRESWREKLGEVHAGAFRLQRESQSAPRCFLIRCYILRRQLVMWEPRTLVYIPILCALGPEKHMPGGPVRQLRTLLSLLSFCVTCALKFHQLSELRVLGAQSSDESLWGAGCVVQVFRSLGRSWEMHGSGSSLRATPGLGLRVRLCLSAFPAHVLFLIYPICRSHSDGFWVIFRRKCSVCDLTCDTSTERRNFKKSPGSPS